MITQVTQGIKITVLPNYMDIYSKPEQQYFLFSYKVYIENTSDQTVQLLRRHWHIFDATGEQREVEGEGVVGHQPILAPGDVYEYESVCNLGSEIGAMRGSYLMQRDTDKACFNVHIPEFQLIVPYVLN